MASRSLSKRSNNSGATSSNKRPKKCSNPITSLFPDVAEGDITIIPKVAQDLIDRYKLDERTRNFSRAQLRNFIFEVCGMNFSEVKKCNKELAEYYPIDEDRLPNRYIGDDQVKIITLIGTTAMRKSPYMFRHFPCMAKNCTTFWDCLIIQSQNEPFFFHILEESMTFNLQLSRYLPEEYNSMPILMGQQIMNSITYLIVDYTQSKTPAHKSPLEQELVTYFHGFFLMILQIGVEETKREFLQNLEKWIAEYPHIFSDPIYQKVLQEGQPTHT